MTEPAWRIGRRDDCSVIARIYNAAIDERVATFETTHRTATDVGRWFEQDRPIVVVDHAGKVAGFAAAFIYRDRPCYAGIGEFSVYVDGDHRGTGIGAIALSGLETLCRARGFWKLASRIFPENTASLALCERAGFRVVGMYRRHAKLDGEWRDVVIVEKLIDDEA